MDFRIRQLDFKCELLTGSMNFGKILSFDFAILKVDKQLLGLLQRVSDQVKQEMKMDIAGKIHNTEQALNLSFSVLNTNKWMKDEKDHTNNMLTE